MLHKTLSQVPETPMLRPGFQGMTARFALTRDDGCPTFAMRLMEFAPGGHTSLHSHAEEHEFYFLEGEAAVAGADGRQLRVQPGDFVYTRPDEPHQLLNLGTTDMRVICIIPILPGGDGKRTTER
jgi:quercetin dioxygenase-like cupin family protein